MAFDPTTARPVEVTRGFAFDPSTATLETETPRKTVFDPSTATPFIDARTKKEETPEEQSVFRQVADIPLQLQKGAVTGVRLISDMFGADSATSKNLRLVEDHLAGLMSAQSKQDSREIARIFKDAEDKGIGANLAAAVKAIAIAPVDTIVNALGTSAPAIVAGLTATLAGAPTAAVLGTTAAVGSAMGAGTIKGAIYETVTEELIKAGLKPAEAEARAVKAQEYFGENMGMIVTGAGLGTLEAITGAQPAIARMIANKLARKGAVEIAEDVAEQAAKGYLGTAAKSAVKEAAPEFLQGAQEQLAKNLALQDEGFDVPTMRGVVGQGAFEALAGAGLGATTGVAGVASERRAATQEQRELDRLQTLIDEETKQFAPTEGVADVVPSPAIDGAVEPSPAMPVGGTEAVTGGIETPLATGLATAEQLTGEPITGAAVQPTALTPPLPTLEQAQAVLDTLENKEQLQIQEAPDGGFVVAQRAPMVEPTAVAPIAPIEMVGEAAPVETGGVTPEAVQPTVQVAPAEAVEAAPIPEAIEPIATPAVAVEAAAAPEAIEPISVVAQAETELVEANTVARTKQDALVDAEIKLRAAITEFNSTVRKSDDTTSPAAVELQSARYAVERANADYLNASRGVDIKRAKLIEAQSAAKKVETTPAPTEEPSVAEAIETVQAKEERPQETAATVAAIAEQAEAPVRKRAPGGGRKKSEFAKTTEERGAQSADLIQDARDIEGRAKAVQKLSLGFAPEQFAKRGVSAEQAQAAYEEAESARKEDLWNNKMYLYIASVDPTRRDTKAGRVAREAVAQFTPQEQAQYKELYASYKAGQGRAPLKSTSIYMSDTADPKFGTATTAQQALRRIMNTGKPFEKLLAQRLLNAVKGVQFVVIRPDTKLPAEISKAFRDTTQGVYSEARKTIYVRDESFGDVNGVNNTTILHEALHAATTLRLDYALALAERGELDTAPALQAFAQMMTKTMERAALVYRVAEAEGRSTPYLDGLNKVGAFTDVREFVSYGLTDNMMQQFLATQVPGMKMSMFSRFVEAIRKLFGFDANSQSAFQDLVVTTDALLSERLPRDASLIATTPDTLAAIKSNGKKVEDFDKKLKQPLASPEEALTTIGQIIKVRSWDDAKDVVSDIYNGTGSQFRRPMLGALTTRQLTELKAAKDMTDADGKPLLDEVLRIAEDMNGAKSKMLDETADMAKVWHEWQRANPNKYRTLNRLIHLSTINQLDPSVDTRSATLTQMYEALGADGKKLYNDIRDFYKARFDQYKQILLDRIAQTEADDATKAQIIAKLEKDFAKLPQPYFPLVREGKYWVRIGNPKSPNMEYYMFEDPRERNFFVRQRAKELGTTVEALKEDESNIFAMGDDFKQAVDEGMRSSKMLKDILEMVDNASMTDKAALKDEIHQLYFSTLPEQNFRKHFIHRKGTAGFRSDALRNFAKSSFHTSVQLAKIEYGQKLRGAVTRAWDATEGKPQREILFRPLVDEMKDRVENVLSPDRSDAAATKFANFLGSASFLYYMSAPASAITNLSGLFVFGMPVLNGEFGPQANLALAKNMNIFKAVGTTDKDGKFTFPTLLSRLSGHRRDAYMEALRRGKIDTTLTYDTLQLARTPSEQYSGSTTSVMNAVGYLFHHSEKINREVMFMTAYDLAYERATKAGRDVKTAQEEALNEASRMTDEAMFDYSEFNKPRFFRGNVARVILQFKSFAQQTTFYLVKNFKAMFGSQPPGVRSTAATKFIGTLGMTAMFAGALGLPLVSVLTWAMSLASEDDKDPEKRNAKLRFRKFLREEFGEDLGLAIERGPISWATDIDFHSRVKLDQLWFREMKSGKSEPEALKEFMINMLGPSVGLAVNASEAMRRINDGDVQRGVEMLLPAGLRGFAVAMRMNEEGVRNLKDDKIISRDKLSEKEIAIAATGFAPVKVAATQEDAAQAREQLDKINEERGRVLTLFKDLNKKFTPSRRDEAFRSLKEFNRKNPMVGLDADTIIKAVEGEVEASATAVRGIRVTEKLRPALERLLPRSPYKE